MALEVWPLVVFIVFNLLWLRRRCAARRRALMVGGHGIESTYSSLHRSAITATAIFVRTALKMTVYCLPAATDCLGQAEEPVILALSCHELERHKMEAEFSCFQSHLLLFMLGAATIPATARSCSGTFFSGAESLVVSQG